MVGIPNGSFLKSLPTFLLPRNVSATKENHMKRDPYAWKTKVGDGSPGMKLSMLETPGMCRQGDFGSLPIRGILYQADPSRVLNTTPIVGIPKRPVGLLPLKTRVLGLRRAPQVHHVEA